MIKTRTVPVRVTGDKEADAVIAAIRELCLDLACDKKISQARLDEVKLAAVPFMRMPVVPGALLNLRQWIELSENPITP